LRAVDFTSRFIIIIESTNFEFRFNWQYECRCKINGSQRLWTQIFIQKLWTSPTPLTTLLRGLLKLVGYNPYPCPVPVPVPGYRRVHRYRFEKGRSVFFGKNPLYPYPLTRRPYPRTRRYNGFRNRYNGLLKRYNVS
jgi:hypothetical protein